MNNTDNGMKTEKKLFCLSKEEARILREKSSAMGMNESEYLRFLISQKPKDYPEIRSELKKLINEINHIGVNINQIAKNHNSSYYLADDKERLFAYMKKLNLIVKEMVDQIGNQ